MIAAILFITGTVFYTSDLAAAPVKESTASLLSVTVEETALGVRLRVEGSPPLSTAVFQLAGPRRLIVDVTDGDVTKLDENALNQVRGIEGFRTIQYHMEEGSIGRLEFLLSEKFVHSSSQEGNFIIVDLVRPDIAEGAVETSEPVTGAVEVAGQEPAVSEAPDPFVPV
jgi:hypothetical protein